MPPANNDFVKVLFQFHSDVLEEDTNETMWAEVVDADKGVYKLDSIPFYAPDIASGDLFLAEFDPDQGMLKFKETIAYSGNSTVQVIIYDQATETNAIRDVFIALGCTTEKLKEGYFVIDIPAALNYERVRAKLKELHAAEVLAYAESRLAENHQYC